MVDADDTDGRLDALDGDGGLREGRGDIVDGNCKLLASFPRHLLLIEERNIPGVKGLVLSALTSQITLNFLSGSLSVSSVTKGGILLER